MGCEAARAPFFNTNPLLNMPDVGLFTATQPVPRKTPVIIKYSVEVGGLPVYQESYDVDSVKKEWKRDPERAAKLWVRRLQGPIECRELPKFSSNLTQWLSEGCASHADADLCE